MSRNFFLHFHIKKEQKVTDLKKNKISISYGRSANMNVVPYLFTQLVYVKF